MLFASAPAAGFGLASEPPLEPAEIALQELIGLAWRIAREPSCGQFAHRGVVLFLRMTVGIASARMPSQVAVEARANVP